MKASPPAACPEAFHEISGLGEKFLKRFAPDPFFLVGGGVCFASLLAFFVGGGFAYLEPEMRLNSTDS